MAGIGIAGWLVHARSTSQTSTVRYEISVVDRGPIRARVTATGTVNPIKTVQVGTQVSGTIQSLGADFNTVVSPGQVIAQIDPRLFQAQVNQARANLLVAQATTRKARSAAIDARRIARRNHELAGQALIAQQTADTSEANAQVAEAAVDAAQAAEVQARAALDSASLNLSFTRIVSPIHGTVITRNVDVGQTVAASFAAPTLFLIGEDLTKMQVDTNIAEADIGRLAPGMAASFTVDAYPAETFRGTIREVRSSPQIIQNVVTYDAVVDVANPAHKLKPGMTANLEVVYADRRDVLRVANAALRFHPPPELVGKPPPAPLGTRLVWAERGGALAPIVFTPGVSDGSWTEVIGGPLVAGDRVVTEAIGARGGRAM
ncbi:MAG TPA: efflux RND transporter periplasmic adaptor subunit [Kofleriaceae bacterium]|nr:efflux RND transporter periplasmic adaptor subunit [Kofleriaceae bacterium]